MKIAILPARGGSKRIPRKNIRPFLGVPLIARTIQTLIEVSIFDQIIVSTDDQEIADIAIKSGAEVPFLRPAHISDDYATTRQVIVHAIEELEKRGDQLDLICCVYPAAVLVTPKAYLEALELLNSEHVDYVFTACSFPHPIQRALRMTEDGFSEMFWPEFAQARSQDLEQAFHDAGQFYFGKRQAWIAKDGKTFSRRSKMLILPSHSVQDIDTIEDWERAEQIFKLKTQSHNI